MKKFTYSFLSILMLLLAMPAGLLARTTVTFDFAANPWNLPLGSGSGDDAAKGNIVAPIVQDGVTATFAQGTNEQTAPRMWTGPQIRMYTGNTITFTAPAGKVIEKIEFSGTLSLVVAEGTYDSSSKTWVQPKTQVNSVTFTGGNKPTDNSKSFTTKISKAILTIADPGEGAEVVVLPEITDLASFKACEKDKAVKLTITDGKVVLVKGNDLIVEDATGATDFYNWGLTATAGQVINGTVEAKYSEYSGMPQAAKTANTDIAALTITDGDAVAPVAMEFAEAMKAASYLKYVTLTDFTIEETGGKTYLVSGENKIQLYDKFKVGYTLPEAIKSISGIIIPFVVKGSTDVIVEIAPTSAEDIEDIVAKPVLPEGDVTAKYLVNPGFEDCEAATGKVATADKAQGTDYEAVGWKLASSSKWSNSAAFAYGSDASLNDAAVPATDNAGNTGKALGFTVGWGGTNSYQSAAEVVLPAGYYIMKAHAYNGGTATQFASKLGFTTADKAYTSTKNSFALNEWVEDVVEFTLESETAGHFTIGGAAVSGGSGANGKVFFDNITLERQDLFTAVNNNLAKEIAAAKEIANAGLAPTADLLAAIATAEAATTKTDYKEILAAIEPLKAAVATYNDVNAHFVAFADAKAKYATIDTKYASDEKIAAVNAIAEKTPATADEADALKADYIKAVRSLVESNALAEGVEGATNYTESIKNANAEALDGWTIALGEINKGAIKVLNNEPFTDAEGNSTHSYFDGGSWNDNAWDVTFSQDVTLPKGKYLLTATSRASAELSSFALFAGEARAEMMHVGASGELFDRGWNDNSVEFEVTEDDAVVNLGVQGVTDKQHQWMSFTRFRLVKVGEVAPVAPEIPVVENIAALSKIEGGEMENPSVKLMLKNAKITYVQNTEGDVNPEYSVMYALLEDETGAVEISDLVAKAKLNNWFNGELKEGVALNGYVIVDYSSFFPRLVVNAETAKSEVTITPTEITPTVVTIADAQKPENHLRMFELQNVELVKEGEEYAFKQDGNIIAAVDMFKNMLDEMPTNIESVTGVLFLDMETYCFVPISYEAAPAAPIEVNSIAELNKLGKENEGATIKLKLTNAQITVADASMSSAIIEDETGAFNAQYFFAEAMGMEMLTGDFKQGSVLNGDLYCLFSYPGTIEVSEENTAKSQITITEAPVVPTEADFAEVLKAENNFRLYEFKNITVNKNEADHFQLVKGDAKAEIADRTRSLEESMMATVESVVGYFRIAGDEAEFTLISYKTATPDGISSIAVAAKNAAVYNLNGAKVLGAGESVKGLAKGIYVVGGKKIVVK